MQSPFDAIFDEAENRYLTLEELRGVGQYVVSLNERVLTYRLIRDRELSIMQDVADRIEYEIPNVKPIDLERSLKNGLLSLRYCSMAMLLNDKSFVQDRLLAWLSESIQIHELSLMNTALVRLMVQQLHQTLTEHQMDLLQPFLDLIQIELPIQEEERLTIAGIF